MHERQAEDAEEPVDESNHQEVPVVGVTLYQLVVRRIHHRSTRDQKAGQLTCTVLPGFSVQGFRALNNVLAFICLNLCTCGPRQLRLSQ